MGVSAVVEFLVFQSARLMSLPLRGGVGGPVPYCGPVAQIPMLLLTGWANAAEHADRDRAQTRAPGRRSPELAAETSPYVFGVGGA